MDQNQLPTTIHTSSSTPRDGDGAVSVLGASMLMASFDEDECHQFVLEHPPPPTSSYSQQSCSSEQAESKGRLQGARMEKQPGKGEEGLLVINGHIGGILIGKRTVEVLLLLRVRGLSDECELGHHAVLSFRIILPLAFLGGSTQGQRGRDSVYLASA